MSDRQQPDLSTTQGSSYRRGNNKAATGRSNRPTSTSGPGIGSSLIMAILLGGLVLAGWFIANQQEMLLVEQKRADDADARLRKVEARLSATDSAMAQGGEDTQEKLGLWESEIRKLWAISNERNKNWIQDNQRAVKKITASLNGVDATSRDLKASVARHETAFTQQQTLIDQLTSVELQLQQMARGQRDLVDKVNSAAQSVASLRSQLSSKVDDNSEAIQSNDAFRIALNSRLADIDRRLAGALGAPIQ